ncbi:MAG TPA: efflux RND transporter periplasmic adaptor subunit [Thiobacillaceae bacterium]|nr:efflux RND transporter periplasmic adaptor subunit [Thiobacillaceae bacterium]
MNAIPPTPADRTAELERLLGGRAHHRFPARRWMWLGPLLALLLAGLGYGLWKGGQEPAAPRFHTEPVILGTLVVKVSATGKLQPTNQVDVGSELSGIVEKVLVDENDRVRKGQELARLDLSKLNDAVAKSSANLAAAEAQSRQTQATLAEARANLSRLRQVAELSGGKVPSKNEMDGAEANVKRAEANLASAASGVAQAQAGLRSDETNLAKAHIRSPIDGVVLTRKVEPGQTVAASLQAPVLFTLAEDLAKMELQVDVDEADVGQVEVGQSATFGVDAWPGREYPASIIRVGYGSQVTEGVVSYPTALRVDNEDLSLRPGMTATAEITTLRRADVLLVPNAALRFTPPSADAGAAKSRGMVGMLMPRPPRQAPKQPAAAADKDGGRRVWVLRDGQLVPLTIHTGASDGRMTEVVGGDLKAGMQVITESLSGKP